MPFPKRWTRRDTKDKKLIDEQFDRSPKTTSEPPPPLPIEGISDEEFEQEMHQRNTAVEFCPECQSLMILAKRAKVHIQKTSNEIKVGLCKTSSFRCERDCRNQRTYFREREFVPYLAFTKDTAGYYRGELTTKFISEPQLIAELPEVLRKWNEKYIIEMPHSVAQGIEVSYTLRSHCYITRFLTLDTVYNLPEEVFRKVLVDTCLAPSISKFIKTVEPYGDVFVNTFTLVQKSPYANRIQMQTKQSMLISGKIQTYKFTSMEEVFIGKRKIALTSCSIPSGEELKSLVSVNVYDLDLESIEILEFLYILLHDDEFARNDIVFADQIYGSQG